MWELYLLKIGNEESSEHTGNRWRKYSFSVRLFYINNAIKKTRYLLKEDWEDEKSGVYVDVKKYCFSTYDDLKETKKAILEINKSRADDEQDYLYVCKDRFDVMDDEIFEELCQILGAKKEF